ncbi:MAG: Holliday junction resolvase RuvX [Casimicrobium sp.]
MKGRTYLAFDFGEKRIGVAVGSDIAESANALATIDATNDDARFSAIAPLVSDWQPFAFVVGHPTHPDGTPHAMTARAEKFARQLEGRFHCRAYLVDERYSSYEAEVALAMQGGKKAKSKAAIDAEAAATILRRFFESGGHREKAPESTGAP